MMSGNFNTTGEVRTVTVGGSVVGGAGAASGIATAFGISLVKIAGDVVGGDGLVAGIVGGAHLGHVVIGGSVIGGFLDAGSGQINASVSLGSVTLGGSLLGGGAEDSGKIFSAEIGKVKIANDVVGGTGEESGTIQGVDNLGGVTLGGSLFGGAALRAGSIIADFGDVGFIKISGQIEGGTGDGAGALLIGRHADRIEVGGSVTGSAGEASGFINANLGIGSLEIGGDLVGGAEDRSGFVSSGADTLKRAVIGGSIRGGTANQTGGISAAFIGTLFVGGDIAGGSVDGNEAVSSTGFIDAISIASLRIGGSLLAGTDSSTGSLTNSGSVTTDLLGRVKIGGSVVGTIGSGGVTKALISATGGVLDQTSLAIKSLTIGGRVELADILAGYNRQRNPLEGDASIGPVKVGGAWLGSNLVAGVLNLPPDDINFGDANDAVISNPNNDPNIASRIASITIRGQVIGTADATDHFGFVAQEIGAFKIGGKLIPHATPGFHNLATDTTNDVAIHTI